MHYGSVCSGIEAASVAWHQLGWRAAWFAEIEKFPAAVLAHHYPAVPNLGDMTRIARGVLGGSVAAPDVLVGGTPCQAFSVAGMRAGLDDPRGALTIKFVELADAIDHVRVARGDEPAVIVWENVPGYSATEATPSAAFLGRLLGKTANCSLQGEGGRTLVVCMDPKEQSRGGYLTPNISAWPNDGVVCSLSQVLQEDSIPPQYFLSAKACAGILRRADARGKTLPGALLSALRSSADAGISIPTPLAPTAARPAKARMVPA